MKSFLQITQEIEKVADLRTEELKTLVAKPLVTERSKEYGMFKAIFVSGGPGSGKDLIIREAISDQNVTELNATLALSILNDKHKLSEQSKDLRKESIRNRQALIINGTTNEYRAICDIKEELEQLGYETLMIFVNTTNESSKKRNESLSRMLPEDVRFKRWKNTQELSEHFEEMFDKCLEFDNSLDMSEATKMEKRSKQEDMRIISAMSEWFFDSPITNEIAETWLRRNKKSNINKMFEQIVDKSVSDNLSTYGKMNRKQTVRTQMRNLRNLERRHDQTRKVAFDPMKNQPEIERKHNIAHQASLQTLRNRLRFEEKTHVSENKTNSKTIPTEKSDCSCDGTGGSRKKLKLLDNICPSCQLTAKQGRSDSVTDGDIASNTKYTFRTYHEGSNPTFITKGPEKETRFQQDNDKSKAKKYKSKAESGKVLKVPGLSPEYDTRGSGTVYPMSGLGNVTYKEQVDNKYDTTAEVTRKSFSKFRKESIDSPSTEMGVTGGYYGPSNKEPMETLNKIPTNPKIKKIKK